MKNFPLFPGDRTTLLLHKNYLTPLVLKNHEEVVTVFKGLINFDDLRVVKGCEDRVFPENSSWVLDMFLLDPFDSSDGVWITLHFSLVDSGKCSPANDLNNDSKTC